MYQKFQIYTVQDFIERYDSLSWSQYDKLKAGYVMNCISDQWITQVDSGDFGDQSPLDLMILKWFSVRNCHNVILYLKPPPVNHALRKWCESLECEDINWQYICSIAQQLEPIRLRSFYLKFINRGFIFNARKSRWTPQLSPLCRMCKLHDETYIHVFWECSLIRPLWTNFIQWCTRNLPFKEVYSKENCLLKGFSKSILNVVMTIFKQHILILCCYGGEFNLQALFQRIEKARIVWLNAYKQLPYLNVNKALALWAPFFSR